MTLTADAINSLIHAGLPAAPDTGFIVERVEGQRVYCRNRYHANQLRPGGTLSGPTLMGLADAAMYAVVLANLGPLEMAVTQNLNINFLRKPVPRDLIAVAEPLKIGRRSVALEVRIYSEGDPAMVAHVTGSYALPYVA
jgi:uncharacterized protein (TIGR00369 family)